MFVLGLFDHRGIDISVSEHGMSPEGDSAREEHGDLKACRQLLSIRARLRKATICVPVDRVTASTSTDPDGGVQESSTETDSSLGFDNPVFETFSSTLSEKKEAATQVRENEERPYNRHCTSQTDTILQDLDVTNLENSERANVGPGIRTSSEDQATQGPTGREASERPDQVEPIRNEDYLPKLDAKKPVECAAVVLDDEEPQQECRSAAEAALGLSRRLARAESLRRKEVMMIMERLYRDHPGAVWRRRSREAIKAVEAKEREPVNAKVLIYGEISFIAFTKLLEIYSPPSSGFTFYDLGCGAGRPVFMASLLMTNCVKACGVEIIPSMHRMNEDLLELYDVEIRKWLHPSKQAQSISFVCGDMLQVDWSGADVVFTNATCFDDKLFGNLEARAKKILKEGVIVIVVTRRFQSDSVWELLNQTERRMSWSPAVVSVYRKRAETLKLPTVETRE